MSDGKIKVVRRVAWIAGAALLAAFLGMWTHGAEAEMRYVPEYSKEDISSLLECDELTEEEYRLLYYQTGLTPLGVDALWEQGREKELLELQERFFAEVTVCCEQEFLLFNEVLELPGEQKALHAKAAGRVEAAENAEASEHAKAAENAEASEHTKAADDFMPTLENGDILITFNSHFLGWRNGHAAIVVDAERGKTVEALSMGTDSTILSIKSWNDCPSFAVLRLTEATAEQRAAIAAYAEENLTEKPYRLTAGIFGGGAREQQVKGEQTDKGQENTEQALLSGTNCSHLVWQAYMEYGYDLDSDGGIIVTPKDLYESPMLELVQVYGMNPEGKTY